MTPTILGILVLMLVTIDGFKIPSPKAVTVDCQSLGDSEEFRHRMKHRQNAEDQTTIWLFRNEILSIHFSLSDNAVIDVLDVRYSNDGDWDNISLSLDNRLLGSFKTRPFGGWGDMWNVFASSGPIGGRQYLGAGKHSLMLNVMDADEYGVEIDYIRFNVHGAKIERLDENNFMCVHTPSDLGIERL